MSNSQNLISDLRKKVTEYQENGNTEFEMMALRMLEKQCRVESDDENLAYSLKNQIKILRKSGDLDRANQLQKELENIRKKRKKISIFRTRKTVDNGSRVVETSGRYIKMSCGLFVDTQTNLEWFLGPDINVSKHQAIAWVEKLEECGGSWRMPKLSELGSLYQKSGGGGLQGNMDRIFPKMGGSFVWSEEEGRSSEVQVFFFEFGMEFKIARTRMSDCRVFAVRSKG